MPYSAEQWNKLVWQLKDWNGHRYMLVPGVCLLEWLQYVQYDYDDVDRVYIDADTIGG